jgi:hypothetical protein
MDLTLDMCTPSRRWMPEQLRHTSTCCIRTRTVGSYNTYTVRSARANTRTSSTTLEHVYGGCGAGWGRGRRGVAYAEIHGRPAGTEGVAVSTHLVVGELDDFVEDFLRLVLLCLRNRRAAHVEVLPVHTMARTHAHFLSTAHVRVRARKCHSDTGARAHTSMRAGSCQCLRAAPIGSCTGTDVPTGRCRAVSCGRVATPCDHLGGHP